MKLKRSDHKKQVTIYFNRHIYDELLKYKPKGVSITSFLQELVIRYVTQKTAIENQTELVYERSV